MLKEIKSILGIKKYLIWTVLSSIVMFVAYWFLTFMFTYNYSPAIFAQINGLWYMIFSLIFNAFISILVGVSVAVLVYKLDMRKKTRTTQSLSKVGVAGATSFGGTTVGVAASGCPVCGALLPSLVGVPLGLGVLPFKGLELKLLSTAILLGTLYFGTRNSDKCEACENPKVISIK